MTGAEISLSFGLYLVSDPPILPKTTGSGLAIGSALSGTGLTIGENVVGMDPEAVFKNGKIVDTVDLKRRQAFTRTIKGTAMEQ